MSDSSKSVERKNIVDGVSKLNSKLFYLYCNDSSNDIFWDSVYNSISHVADIVEAELSCE